MDKKEAFKEFVKKNPKLITYVRDGKATWQKFYEMYYLYGEDNDAWKSYLVSSVAGLDFLSFIKNINLDEVQNGISSIQRVLGMLGDMKEKPSYKPRPMYKHFED